MGRRKGRGRTPGREAAPADAEPEPEAAAAAKDAGKAEAEADAPRAAADAAMDVTDDAGAEQGDVVVDEAASAPAPDAGQAAVRVKIEPGAGDSDPADQRRLAVRLRPLPQGGHFVQAYWLSAPQYEALSAAAAAYGSTTMEGYTRITDAAWARACPGVAPASDVPLVLTVAPSL